MRIEIKVEGGKVIVGACNEECGLVAVGTGETVDAAVREMVSKFAKYQAAAIEALHAGGVIRHIKPESLS